MNIAKLAFGNIGVKVFRQDTGKEVNIDLKEDQSLLYFNQNINGSYRIYTDSAGTKPVESGDPLYKQDIMDLVVNENSKVILKGEYLGISALFQNAALVTTPINKPVKVEIGVIASSGENELTKLYLTKGTEVNAGLIMAKSKINLDKNGVTFVHGNKSNEYGENISFIV